VVRSLWDDVFKGVAAEKITPGMAAEFVDLVKSDPRAIKLTLTLLEKGGAASTAKWLSGETLRQISSTLGLAVGVLLTVLSDPTELNAAEKEWIKEKERKKQKDDEEEKKKKNGEKKKSVTSF
jgi:hypothetical protein